MHPGRTPSGQQRTASPTPTKLTGRPEPPADPERFTKTHHICMWLAHNTLPLCLHRSRSQDAIERSPCRLRSGDQPGWCDTSQAHRAALEVASRCGGPGGLSFLGVADISPAAASHTSISGLTLTSATPGELVSTWDDPVKPRRRLTTGDGDGFELSSVRVIIEPLGCYRAMSPLSYVSSG